LVENLLQKHTKKPTGSSKQPENVTVTVVNVATAPHHRHPRKPHIASNHINAAIGKNEIISSNVPQHWPYTITP
jgi:hypothetical protein